MDGAPRSSFPVSHGAAVTGWVLGSSSQFLSTRGQLRAPAPQPCPWVSSSWAAAAFGVLWERSLFPNSHPGLEGADSEPQEQLTSALSHSPSRPSPCSLGHKGPCACGLSSCGGSGRARARLGSGDILEKLLPLLSWSLCLSEAHSPLSRCPPPPPEETEGECERAQVLTCHEALKLAAEQSD